MVRLSNLRTGGTPPMYSKICFMPSSRHSWFCDRNACVYPLFGVGKGDCRRIAGLRLPHRCVFILERSESYLFASKRMTQRQVAVVRDIYFVLLSANSLLYRRIASANSAPGTRLAVDTPHSMPLFPRNLVAFFQPTVHGGEVVSRYRITLWLGIRQVVLAHV